MPQSSDYRTVDIDKISCEACQTMPLADYDGPHTHIRPHTYRTQLEYRLKPGAYQERLDSRYARARPD